MISVPCASCRALIPVHDKLPAWCPRCGVDFQVGDMSKQTPEPTVGGRRLSLPDDDPILSKAPPTVLPRIPARSAPAPAVPDAQPAASSPAFTAFDEPLGGFTRKKQPARLNGEDLPATHKVEAEPAVPEAKDAAADGEAYDPLRDDPYGLNRTCPACGAVFTGRSAVLAESACPTCGLAPVQAKGEDRSIAHGVTFGVVALIVVVAGLIGSLSRSVNVETAAWLAGIAAGLGGLVQVGILLWWPTGNREAALRKAKSALASGDLEIVRPGNLEAFRDPAALSTKHVLAVIALMIAPAALLLPVILRQNSDLPDNPTLSPRVIGPGDSFTVSFPGTGVSSLGSLWKGVARADIQNPTELGRDYSLPATTRSTDWGQTLRLRKSESGESAISSFPVTIQLPNDPQIAGKTMKLRVTLDVTYPVARGSGAFFPTGSKQFTNKTTSRSQMVSVAIAPSGSSAMFRLAWLGAVLAGGLAYAFGGGGLWLLARGGVRGPSVGR